MAAATSNYLPKGLQLIECDLRVGLRQEPLFEDSCGQGLHLSAENVPERFMRATASAAHLHARKGSPCWIDYATIKPAVNTELRNARKRNGHLIDAQNMLTVEVRTAFAERPGERVSSIE